MGWHPVPGAEALKDGDALALRLAGREVALCVLDGDYYAISNVCTHQYALLTSGFIEDGYIECPLHQGRFDIRTGQALNPPVTTPVKTYPVKVEGGQVSVFVE